MKCRIVAIGFVVDGEPKNWTFDCQGRGVALEIDKQGKRKFAGYTIQELEEISKSYYQTIPIIEE